MNTKLFVGNLNSNTTESSIKAAFSSNGRAVRGITVPTDKQSGRPRGFAFVEMGTEAEAQAAIAELDGHDLDGCVLKVSVALERAFRPKPGGAGGPSR